jgi:hypothetical protein
MTDDHDELRRDLVTSRGLPEQAGRLLVGATVSELEECADLLATFVEESQARAETVDPEPLDPLRAALDPRSRQRRKTELARLLTAPPAPSRDEAGRFEGRASFDGGARPQVPVQGDPEREHGEWLLAVLRSRRADRGAAF